jgi:heme/copper-type cytochrome/quinol oxidase subunit 3
MVLLIVTEATLFTLLIFSYFFLRYQAKQWPPAGIAKPELLRPIIASVILLSSSLPVIWAEHRIKHDDQFGLRAGFAAAFVLGAIFLGFQIYEYAHAGFGLQTHAYTSAFFTITGVHGAHVIGGLTMISVILFRAWRGDFDRRRHLAVQNVALYWHFVDLVWIAVFSSLYLSVYVH